MIRTEFKTKKSRETYEAILATATALFAKKGFAETSLRDIAKRRRMALGALYYYFRSKEEVVLAFYEDLNRAVAEEVRPRIAAEADLAAAFEAYVRAKIARLAPARPFLHVVAREAIDPTSPLSPFSPDARGALDTALAVMEEIVARHGPPAEARPAGLARLLWAAHIALLLYWLHDRSEGQAATERVIETAATALRWLPALREIPGAAWIGERLLAAVGDLTK